MRLRTSILALVAVLAWPAGASAQVGAGGVEALALADTNGDGAISRDEIGALRAAAFRRFDADGDGFISAGERQSAAQGQRDGVERLERADADHDGRISRTEFTRQPMPGFDRFDANDNDVLEASEIEALRNAARRYGR
ncbi:EF-hand domain-containing protein [Terricaulis sp.]|uniref:EF-hand domain-containing protein n=1 Tax=Terricaulis sp. TaxID=2768686 RepID=UPI002AC6016F|nr:EF-hand domain-containing protein [Terricaulis sp.]MDZ4691516.1 EF-hand domain-containing protein [Terricaulis sp.]